MLGTKGLPKTRTMRTFGKLTAAQTAVVRLCWSNGYVAGEKFNPTGADVTIRSLMRRGILTRIPSLDEYILTDQAALDLGHHSFKTGKAF